MIFQQFRHDQGGCLSYLIGCSQRQVAVVVDPQLEIEQYLRYASSRGMQLTRVVETHAQADHLSGARLLAERTGAPVLFHESVEAGFPIQTVRDGERIGIGNIECTVLHTPGHTPDSICVLVGDTLFVGDTGRPDLDGSADQLYDSIWGKLLTLNDSVEIYPTHSAGSTCGKSMSAKPSSTIGYERRFNPSLRVRSKREFIEFVSSDLPVQPPRFKQVRQYNLGFIDTPPIDRTYDVQSIQMTVEELKDRLDRGERPFLLDVREPFEFRIANLGGQLIPLREVPMRMNELDRNEEIVVYCHHGNRSRRAVEFLYESGFTNVKNLVGGIDAWSKRIDSSVPLY
jgi:hydroxyacylglutathione hydrolase